MKDVSSRADGRSGSHDSTDRREGHVTTWAKNGVMQPQAKDHLEPPEAGRGMNNPLESQTENNSDQDCWAGPTQERFRRQKCCFRVEEGQEARKLL